MENTEINSETRSEQFNSCTENKEPRVERESNTIYIPEVSNERKPEVGQEFSSLDDAFNFYNSYAKETGFGVRKSGDKKRKDENGFDEIIRKEYVCNKEGKSSLKGDHEISRRKGSIRAGCKARLVVVKSTTNKYIVKVFDDVHNHILLTPSKTHFLKSHRQVTDVQKSLSQQFNAVNIPTHQQCDLLAEQAGGYENVGCIQKDLYNNERDKRDKLKGHDGKMFHKYLELEKIRSPSFTYKIEADHEHRIKHCFWADATSRQDYAVYGDVIVFDTTYNINRYGLIFAPFIGVNNHGQTIVFGCALISGETVDSFVWLFNQFLEAMSGSAPKMIITDQDPAMSKAIFQVLPNTFHRYCIWHIATKFSKKLDAVKYKAYYNAFSTCIWNTRTTEQFDVDWSTLLKESGLSDTEWLETIYELRSRWVPVYVNHIFSAGMSSSQRAESNHAFFKKFVRKNDSLVDFMVKFSRGIQKKRHEILYADHKDLVEKPRSKIDNHILKQMVVIYTREIFFKFEEELLQSLNYKFQLFSESETERVYRAQKKGVEADEVHQVCYEKHTNFASCTCRKFDSVGIPCRHILGYFHIYHDLEELPEIYILKRWTKSANGTRVTNSDHIKINDDKSLLLERNRLIQSSLQVIDKALVNTETKHIYLDALKNAEEKIKLLIDGDARGRNTNEILDFETNEENREEMDHDSQLSYREPNQVRSKGCGKRLKGGKEKALENVKRPKPRKCRGCGLFRQGHDLRNCKKLAGEHGDQNPSNVDDNSTGI